MPTHRLPGFSSNRPDGNLRLNRRSRNQFLEVPSIRGVVAANDVVGPDCLRARPSLAHALATVLRASLTAFDRSPKTASGRLEGLKPVRRLAPARGAARRRGRSTSARCSAGGGSSSSGRRCASDRSLRQGEQGDTIEAIAPDAATPRSRHVARRMACASSWTLLRIVTVAVVDVGRAQVPLGMLAV
jgi:hypothetical protein